MLNRLFIVGWAITALLVSAPGYSATSKEDQFTGEAMLRHCEQFEKGAAMDPLDAGVCMGFIRGFMDGVVWGEVSAGKTRSISYCQPPGLELGQHRLLLVTYLRENPDKLQEQAFILFAAALKRAYPCRP